MGTWKCSGESQDALHLLKWDDDGLSTIGRPFLGNLFTATKGETSISAILSVVKAPSRNKNTRIIIAVDAVFGWPIDFHNLVNGRALFVPAVAAKDKHSDNKYLFRETERFLIDEFKLKSPYLPKTAVGDAIGTAATKAQHFMVAWRKDGCYIPPLDAWSIEQANSSETTVIEVYPGVTHFSPAFEKLDVSQATKVASLRKDDSSDAIRCALVGVCYAMTVEIIGGNFPSVHLPPNDKASQSLLRTEGWIFTPKRM